MNTPVTIYQVDAFTSEPFKGNPAGVCLLDKEPDELWMQNIAMEMNVSETAFVFSGQDKTLIRFYTPEAEIQLCGHATLSASHIMYETGLVKHDREINLISKAGELITSKQGDWIIMNFPTYELLEIPVPVEFEKLTGVRPAELYQAGYGWTLALLDKEEQVRRMVPEFIALKYSEFGSLIVTAPSSDPEFDFCVRCFVPALGIDEDPVTGSAHCALVPFWSEKTGKTDFISRQVSKRSGILKVSLKGNRVEISGMAKTIFRADLFV
jgi:PhzF family phenazine biosynthesis protein